MILTCPPRAQHRYINTDIICIFAYIECFLRVYMANTEQSIAVATISVVDACSIVKLSWKGNKKKSTELSTHELGKDY